MPKFCSQCGSPLNENALFCSSCGYKVVRDDEHSVENTPLNPDVKENIETETVKAEENTTDKNTSADSENKVAEAEKSDTSNETENISDAVADNESVTNTPVQETPVGKQPSDEPTAVDKGIAFAKDKIGDGYEKFKTSPNRDKYIGFSAIGIVLIVIICVLMSVFLGGGYKSAVKDYMNAIEHSNFNDYKNAVPKVIYKAMLNGEYNGDKDKMKLQFDEFFDQSSLYIDDIDYDILGVDKINADEIESSLRNQYELYADDKIKVSKAYAVSVKIVSELEGDFGERENRIKQTLIVAKVNGDWGVVNNPDNLFSNLF